MISSLRTLCALLFFAVVSLSSCDVEKTFYIENKSTATVHMVLSDPICDQFNVLKSLAKDGRITLKPGFDTTFLLGPGGWDDRTERFDLRECIDNSLVPVGGGEDGVGEKPAFFMNQYGYKDHEMKLIFE
ncbi:hypothetical protein CLV84_4003 [Neolewinella xylanilytica]|uniref:Uncharacterized protein n=1 Tax=Neolewinella xylanilytica TaxID=1514080 RepID=A0A2S6I050_9BACT|nr:hypothetical protein [Neolewinella xylanilytica]PPK84234.1 hypothetical protein CLV84_4003 [Neolewinella xylanilytica]